MSVSDINLTLLRTFLKLPLKKLRKRSEINCKSCAYYHKINFKDLVTSLQEKKDVEFKYDISKKRLETGFSINLSDVEGLCILRNRRRMKTCRYFSYSVFNIEPEKRLKYHTMHKERFYGSLTFGVSATAILIGILAILLT